MSEQPLRILLVDDNPDDSTLILRELRQAFTGLEMEQVTNPDSFAQALQGGAFDLVITDYQLRWDDGLSILRQIKARDPNCPVIMFTGTGGEEITVEAIWVGLDDDVLTPPKDFARLPAAVRLALERSRQREALDKAENRYRSLFEGVPVGLYRSTQDARFIEVNPAMVRMLGYPSREALLQASITDLYVDSEARKQWQKKMTYEGVVLNFEAQLSRFDSTVIFTRDSAHAVHDPQGEIRYYEGCIVDITERKRLEEELLKAAKLESLGLLAGGIAHDFNNILTAIIGNISVAKRYAEQNQTLRDILQDAEQASLKAKELTQQLLTFSQEGAPIKKTASIAEIVEDSVRFALRGSKAKCVYNLSADLWPVEVDEGQISRVIHNLVINADQSMHQGGLIRVTASNVTIEPGGEPPLEPGNYVRIGVQDQGGGIPPEHMPKIFDPFFTTKPSGTGLGLATVYSIVRKHNGHVAIESVFGEGSTFHIFLPASDKELPSKPHPKEVVLPGQEKVLVMDDNVIVREITARMLDHLGYRFTLAQDGSEALSLYRQAHETDAPFDIVLLDLTVPGDMGARETIERLLAFDPNARAIVCSGYANDPLLSNYREHGFHGMIVKPYKLEDLSKVLRKVLEEHGAST